MGAENKQMINPLEISDHRHNQNLQGYPQSIDECGDQKRRYSESVQHQANNYNGQISEKCSQTKIFAKSITVACVRLAVEKYLRFHREKRDWTDETEGEDN